ncbi:hypothetical protein Peur_049708 [Populus x canadensis]
MYNWMGWRLCSSNLCKNGNGREAFQSRAHFTSAKQGGHFASLPFCGFVIPVQFFFCQLITTFPGIHSTMRRWLWSLV